MIMNLVHYLSDKKFQNKKYKFYQDNILNKINYTLLNQLIKSVKY